MVLQRLMRIMGVGVAVVKKLDLQKGKAKSLEGRYELEGKDSYFSLSKHTKGKLKMKRKALWVLTLVLVLVLH